MITKLVAALLVCVSGESAVSQSSAIATVTPVKKVVDLMTSMLEKGKAEKHEEEVQFAAYKQFCDDTVVEKQQAIKDAAEVMEVLKADIQKYTSTTNRLTKEIASLDDDIAVWKGDSKAATQVREIEKADYDATHKDYSESIDALERAIAVLKQQAFDRKQSLLQVTALNDLSLIPPQAKRTIDAFLQQEPDEGLAVSAPEADGYQFQSKGVIEMLEKLLDKFVAERTKLEKEEMETRHAYETLMQDLTSQSTEAKEDRTEKAETKAKKLQARADAKGELGDTVTTKNADQKYLDDLIATCEQKATDFESRQQLRAEELDAIAKAIEIISSKAVSGSANKYLPSLLQAKKPALAQLRSDSHSLTQMHLSNYLRERARDLNSRVLSLVADRVDADPFKKVKKLIKDLIVRLMEEATEEAEHKGWCDMELSTNGQTRKEKSTKVETLNAEIDQLNTSIAKLTEDIADLSKAVSELDSAVAEATKLRREEKANNKEAIEDAKQAQTAVAQALTVLQEFYAKSGQATALLQQQPEAPEIFGSPYKGMQSENGGVVGMLEVLQSDFARLEADTSAAETVAQKEYDSFMTDSKVDKVSKSKEIDHKTTKKQDEMEALTVKSADLEGTQKELDAALAYFDKLKPSCVEAGVSYEDRVARRKEEIQSLQQALKIINGDDIA